MPHATEGLAARLDAHLRQHAAFGSKLSGSRGDAATADWIREHLAHEGFSLQSQDIGIPVFSGRTTRLLAGDAGVALLPQLPAVPTDASGIRAPLAVIRHVFEASDAWGCIALVVLPFARHATIDSPAIGPLVKAVADAGALAIGIVTTGPTGEAIGLNAAPDLPFVPVPTAIIAPSDAGPLLRAAHAGISATFVLDGEADRGATVNIVARRERGARWLAFSTPRTGWFDCVGERGTGTAAFLELISWATRRYPDLSLFALNSGAHEFLGAGTKEALPLAPPPADTLLWIHLGATLAARNVWELRGPDGLMPSADPQRMLMASSGMLPVAIEAFAGLSGLEAPIPIVPRAGELSSIADHGYANVFAVLGMHRFFHTRIDTYDKVDAHLLAPVVDAHRAMIEAAVADLV